MGDERQREAEREAAKQPVAAGQPEEKAKLNATHQAKSDTTDSSVKEPEEATRAATSLLAVQQHSVVFGATALAGAVMGLLAIVVFRSLNQRRMRSAGTEYLLEYEPPESMA